MITSSEAGNLDKIVFGNLLKKSIKLSRRHHSSIESKRAKQKVFDQPAGLRIVKSRPSMTGPRDGLHRHLDSGIDQGVRQNHALGMGHESVLVAVQYQERRIVGIDVDDRIRGPGQLMP